MSGLAVDSRKDNAKPESAINRAMAKLVDADPAPAGASLAHQFFVEVNESCIHRDASWLQKLSSTASRMRDAVVPKNCFLAPPARMTFVVATSASLKIPTTDSFAVPPIAGSA